MSAKKVKGSGRKKSSGAGKRVLAGLAAFIVVIMLVRGVLGMVFGPRRGECKTIIAEFQTACNELNVNGMVGTLKPSVANPLRIALGITGAVTNTPTDEMLTSVANALGGLGEIAEGSGQTVSQLFKSVEIKPRRYGLPGRTRKVKCKIYVGGLEQKIYFYITKDDGDVYISKVSLRR